MATSFQETGRAMLRRAAGEADAGPDLGAIADEVRHSFAMERVGLIASFEAQVRYARKHLPRAQVAAALQAIKQRREAELSALERRQSAEVRTCLAAARRQWRRQKPGQGS